MKKNKDTNKVSVLTLLLAANTLSSCTNSLHILGTCRHEERTNQSFQTNRYQAVEMDHLVTSDQQNHNNEWMLEKLKQIAQNAGDQKTLDLIEGGYIDAKLITRDVLMKFEENCQFLNEYKWNKERLNLLMEITKDKDYISKLVEKGKVNLTTLPKDVLIEIKEEMDDPANAQYHTKWWQSRNVIIPGLCLVGGGIILYYKLFYPSSDDTNPASNRNSVRNTCDPLWACFKTNGRDLITYSYNICKKGLTQKMIKDLNLHCYQQPHRLTREAYKAWRSTIAPPPANSPYFSSNPFESNAA